MVSTTSFFELEMAWKGQKERETACGCVLVPMCICTRCGAGQPSRVVLSVSLLVPGEELRFFSMLPCPDQPPSAQLSLLQ